jgi:hypothetical protein
VPAQAGIRRLSGADASVSRAKTLDSRVRGSDDSADPFFPAKIIR